MVVVLLDVEKITEILGYINAVDPVTNMFVRKAVLMPIVLDLAAFLLDTTAITTTAGTSFTSNLILRVTVTLPSESGDAP
jgi:hypothetical protein